MYTCCYCPVVKYSLKKYLSHLELYHQPCADFRVTCLAEHCVRTYKTVACLKSHLYQKHRHLILDCESDVRVRDDVDGSVHTISEEDHASGEPEEDAPPQPLTRDRLVDGLKSHIALFMLKLQEKHVLPRVVQTSLTDI